jgi:hypothetical protein
MEVRLILFIGEKGRGEEVVGEEGQEECVCVCVCVCVCMHV